MVEGSARSARSLGGSVSTRVPGHHGAVRGAWMTSTLSLNAGEREPEIHDPHGVIVFRVTATHHWTNRAQPLETVNCRSVGVTRTSSGPRLHETPVGARVSSSLVDLIERIIQVEWPVGSEEHA